uniref:Reverse transcriptase domain-containing protein n=1 Tax=Cannabis sativa TaxID=3483 RepID=A0A803NUT2_CANSA
MVSSRPTSGRKWKLAKGWKLQEVERNTFILRLTKKQEAVQIARNGPWNICDGFLVVKSMPEGGKWTSADLNSSPIWVRVYEVPPRYRTLKNTNALTQMIGTVISIDRMWRNGFPTNEYIRFQVNIQLNKPIMVGVFLPMEEGNDPNVWTMDMIGISSKDYFLNYEQYEQERLNKETADARPRNVNTESRHPLNASIGSNMVGKSQKDREGISAEKGSQDVERKSGDITADVRSIIENGTQKVDKEKEDFGVAEEAGLHMPPNAPLEVLAEGSSRGLALFWRQRWDVQVTNMDTNKIVAKFGGDRFLSDWVGCFTYAPPKREDRLNFWNDLGGFMGVLSTPWLVMGDLNSVLSANEKVGGRAVARSEGEGLRNFIFNHGAIDLVGVGALFTWTNGQEAERLIWERLDCVIVSPDWLTQFKKAGVRNLAIRHSNHAPIILDTRMERENFNAPFRYLDAWSRDSDPPQIIENTWKSGETNHIRQEDKMMEISEYILNSISEAENERLSVCPTEEEIKRVVWSLPPLKSPGPDSFPVKFFKQYWDVVGMQVVNFVQEFFHNEIFCKEVNRTFIVLIPKKPQAERFDDYRPISLCNSTYKIVSEILANRLSTILDKLISPQQAAFVKGRNIAKNSIIANEIVHDMKRRHCISLVSFQVLINGGITKKFFSRRGIRQGDPLSPLLFILCGEVLSRMFLAKEIEGALIGYPIGVDGQAITHLMYADDLVVFLKADCNNVASFKGVMDKYCRWSGQVINDQKSKLYFSKNCFDARRGEIMDYFGYDEMARGEKFLGNPFTTGGRGCSDFEFIVEKICSWLEGWWAKLLSQAARTTLINSVLALIPIYTMSVFMLPRKITNKIDGILRRFWLGYAVSPRLYGRRLYGEISEAQFLSSTILRSHPLVVGFGQQKLSSVRKVFGLLAEISQVNVWGGNYQTAQQPARTPSIPSMKISRFGGRPRWRI